MPIGSFCTNGFNALSFYFTMLVVGLARRRNNFVPSLYLLSDSVSFSVEFPYQDYSVNSLSYANVDGNKRAFLLLGGAVFDLRRRSLACRRAEGDTHSGIKENGRDRIEIDSGAFFAQTGDSCS